MINNILFSIKIEIQIVELIKGIILLKLNLSVKLTIMKKYKLLEFSGNFSMVLTGKHDGVKESR